MERAILTSTGLDELRRELDRLRQELAADDNALAQSMERAGDPDEVGEYLDAQRDEELIARRIAVLEKWLEDVTVVDDVPASHERAELGARAEFEDIDTRVRSSFELVSSPESNVERGRLSIDSPVGHALLGHHTGDSVEVVTPKGRRHLRLLAIR